jgi:hypothetical protein
MSRLMLKCFVGLLIAYYTVSQLVFSFKHPHLTNTELFLHIPDALMWKELINE